jgi:nicotinamidase-related amidase
LHSKRASFSKSLIHPDVKPDPNDIVITKTRVSAFYASPLEAILNAQGITHLVLTGIATDGVVEGTARDGADRGYYVTIADDCCATFSEEAHAAVLRGCTWYAHDRREGQRRGQGVTALSPAVSR